jgi:hypothetical protein
MTPKKKLTAKKFCTGRPVIPPTAENISLLSDLNRAVGIIQAVHNTTKGQTRATALQEAIDLISKHLP